VTTRLSVSLFVDQADVEHLAAQWMSIMRSGGDFITVLRG
jgi:hypothetical protein